jgi:hypothetical protein
MNSVLYYCMSEHVALVISLQSWQYCQRQSVAKMAALMLYLNSLYLLTHPRLISRIHLQLKLFQGRGSVGPTHS